MSWDNIYSSPEKHGLTIAAEMIWNDESYQFDMTVIWRRVADGQLFMASDTGCSCPSPFEDSYSIEDLQPVTKFEAVEALQKRQAEAAEDKWVYNPPTADDIAKVASDLMSS